MRRLISVIVLQAYAVALAIVQLRIGVRTDEAKYLLDIPYPHPPVARWTFALLDGWSLQEAFWRLILATLVVQAVWLIWDLVRGLPRAQRIASMAAWLLSASVLYQAGTVMMAPLTALQGLLFVWIFLKGRDQAANGYLIALLWLASLFTAYQAVLFAPLVWGILNRSSLPFKKKATQFAVPVALLALYTLYNPLVPASMMIQGGKDAGQTLAFRLIDSAWVLALGGGIVVSILGTIGLCIRPRFALLASFALVAFYVIIARFDYYAILFLPLLCAGIISFVRAVPSAALPIICLLPLGTIVCLHLRPLSVHPSPVAPTIEAIEKRSAEGDILIVGSFGHEWQQGSRSSVRRYHSRFLSDTRAVICLAPCEEMVTQSQWMRLEDVPVETWIRQ